MTSTSDRKQILSQRSLKLKPQSYKLTSNTIASSTYKGGDIHQSQQSRFINNIIDEIYSTDMSCTARTNIRKNQNMRMQSARIHLPRNTHNHNVNNQMMRVERKGSAVSKKFNNLENLISYDSKRPMTAVQNIETKSTIRFKNENNTSTGMLSGRIIHSARTKPEFMADFNQRQTTYEDQMKYYHEQTKSSIDMQNLI